LKRRPSFVVVIVVIVMVVIVDILIADTAGVSL
jgi:hypothetical protein